jgi:hypothetical protein
MFSRIVTVSANLRCCSGQKTHVSITLPDPLRRGVNESMRQEVSGPILHAAGFGVFCVYAIGGVLVRPDAVFP